MDYHDSHASFWNLSPEQLAERCRLIAEEGAEGLDEAMQDEAARLYEGWMSAMSVLDSDFDGKERRASLEAGLRKRTIEILVHMRGKG